MEIKDISNLFEKYGFKSTLFMLIIFIIVSSLKSKWFGEIIIKMSDKIMKKILNIKKSDNKYNKLITESDIINHDIFNYINFWINSKIPTFSFSTEYRTVIFRKYLTIYLNAYKKKLSEFINNREYQNMDEARLWNAFLELINDIIYEYEKEMENTGIPKIIIEKMKIKNNDTISLTIDLIEGICNSQFYSSEKNLLKVYSILNILLSVLENTISNSEQVCNSINGQLKGLTYDGKTEP